MSWERCELVQAPVGRHGLSWREASVLQGGRAEDPLVSSGQRELLRNGAGRAAWLPHRCRALLEKQGVCASCRDRGHLGLAGGASEGPGGSWLAGGLGSLDQNSEIWACAVRSCVPPSGEGVGWTSSACVLGGTGSGGKDRDGEPQEGGQEQPLAPHPLRPALCTGLSPQ